MSDAATPADIGAIVGNRGGYGDGMNGGFWIFALIVLAFMGNGNGFGWGGNRGGNAVTEADLCNANSFNELKSQVGRMNDQQAQIARQTDNAICNLGYTALQNTNAIQTQLAECCCNLRQEIQAEGNATRAMIQQDKIEALQAKVASLEMDQRFCGVPRLPLTFTYGVNPANLFNNGCGCSNNVLF